MSQTTIYAGDIEELLIDDVVYHVPHDTSCKLVTTVNNQKVNANENTLTSKGNIVKVKHAHAGIKDITIGMDDEQLKILTELANSTKTFSVILKLVSGGVYMGDDMSFDGEREYETGSVTMQVTMLGNYFQLM